MCALLSLLHPDINECIDSSICPLGAQCNNTRGSYTCSCEFGFLLLTSDSGIRLCADINECLDDNLNHCDVNAVCVNTAGNFTCICKEEENFRGDGLFCEGMQCLFKL